MISVEETIIVEGEHDKKKLLSFLDADILVTGGFQIFKNKEMQELIKKIADKKGVLILTDSDRAGFIIRNFLKNISGQNIKHAYSPEKKGKERRKNLPGKEGLLGVEGIEKDTIIEVIKNSGAKVNGKAIKKEKKYTKLDLYNAGLFGMEESKQKRQNFLKKHGLPQKISANALVDILNTLDLELF